MNERTARPTAAGTVYRSTLRFAFEGAEGLLLFPLVFLSWPLSRRWLGNWGATGPEREGPWPGDALAPSAVETTTRAVDVKASADAVWSWVVQFGLGRAGFYSYELLERLVGIPVRNVEAVLSAHQVLDIGAEIKLHPKAPGILVGALEDARHICFGQAGATTESTPDPRRSWSVYIEPSQQTTCRLILRSCIETPRNRTMGRRVGLALAAPIDFVMEQRLLRTIRRLAESVDP